ncbi:MAG TPA: aminopeptidase, partial [Proteobacteria bacterium]|nr:aminopeptidase [Pseudomonadota bacterium]
ASEATAEFMGWITSLFDEAKVVWHVAELGKVDEGGGGTLAKFFARLGPEVVDAGIPVLAMHSPFELIHKADLFMAYKGYRAFFAAPYAKLKY